MGIRSLAEQSNTPIAPVSIGVRSGDTSQKPPSHGSETTRDSDYHAGISHHAHLKSAGHLKDR